MLSRLVLLFFVCSSAVTAAVLPQAELVKFIHTSSGEQKGFFIVSSEDGYASFDSSLNISPKSGFVLKLHSDLKNTSDHMRFSFSKENGFDFYLDGQSTMKVAALATFYKQFFIEGKKLSLNKLFDVKKSVETSEGNVEYHAYDLELRSGVPGLSISDVHVKLSPDQKSLYVLRFKVDDTFYLWRPAIEL